MNPELKQRLIGAIVVTALAAIFIPMLFDDPVDNSGQLVSELVIPATPVNKDEESANKLPASANQVLKTPDAKSENEVSTEEEAEPSSNKQFPSDEPLSDEPEVNVKEGVDETEQSVDEPVNDRSSTSLDTGVVGDTNKPVKTKKTLQKTESSKQKSIAKPSLEADAVVAPPSQPVKKTDTSATKQTAKAKPLTSGTVNKAEKPVVKPAKSSSEFSRWSIQAGTFSKKENATSLMETLRKQGLPVTLEATKGYYRLKVGPTLDKKRAMEMKAKLDSQKIQTLLIAE